MTWYTVIWQIITEILGTVLSSLQLQTNFFVVIIVVNWVFDNDYYDSMISNWLKPESNSSSCGVII